MTLADLKKMLVMKPWVTPGEAAAVLAVSRRRVWQLIYAEKLETISFLGSRHVLLSSIISRLEQRCKISRKGRLAME